MLLRSSSTPVLGSLLSSSESPNHFDCNKPRSSSENHNNVSFLHGGHPYFNPFSCNSSPTSRSIAHDSGAAGPLGFRRVHSDGSLEDLAANMDGLHNSHPPMRSTRRPSSVLQTIPSFSMYNLRDEDEEEEQETEEEGCESNDGLERSVTIGENLTCVGGDYSLSDDKGMGLVGIEENGQCLFDNEIEAPSLFLARGLGLDVGDQSSSLFGGGIGGGSDFPLLDSGGGRSDGSDVENYYKKMVEENCSNALFLSNYAQFLYKTKGDLDRAEEFYARAILAEPGNGEILSQYAKLIWERHHDEERASIYFEQAVQAAPSDSHVLAAYASFLWETEDGQGGAKEDESGSQTPMGVVLANGGTASASA